MAAFLLGAVSPSFGAAATIVDAARTGDTAQVRAFLERRRCTGPPTAMT
jgi:hypothetical protein